MDNNNNDVFLSQLSSEESFGKKILNFFKKLKPDSFRDWKK
jgi:hypothetical protein